MYSALKMLVARKEIKENRRLSLRTIVAESGVSRSTVERLMNNSMRQVPLDELETLCAYLECDVDDILKLGSADTVEIEEQQPAPRPAPYLRPHRVTG